MSGRRRKGMPRVARINNISMFTKLTVEWQTTWTQTRWMEKVGWSRMADELNWTEIFYCI